MPQGFLREGVARERHGRPHDLDGVPRAGQGLVAPRAARPARDRGAARRTSRSTARRFGAVGLSRRRATGCGRAGRPTIAPERDMRALGGRRRGRRAASSSHDAKGEAPLAPRPPAGRAPTGSATRPRDEFGAAFETPQDFVVAGRRTPLALAGGAPRRARRRSRSAARRASSRPRGSPDQRMTLEIDRDGRSVERRELTAGESPSLIEIPIAEKDRGGFGVTLTVVSRPPAHGRCRSRCSCRGTTRSSRSASRRSATACGPGSARPGRVTVEAPERRAPRAGARPSCSRTCTTGASTRSRRTSRPTRSRSIRTAPASAWSRASLGEAYFCRCPGSLSRLAARGPVCRRDALKFYDGYGIGGPGMRGSVVDGEAWRRT